MAYFTGTISHGTTGTKTITCGFAPIYAKITVAAQVGTVDGVIHKSEGWTDGTVQYYNTIYSDTTGHQTICGNTKLVSHYARVGGVITEIINATFNSFTATQFKYNVNTANANYQYFVEIWG